MPREMNQPGTVTLYGRDVELEPLDPDDEVDEVIVIVKTKAARNAGPATITSVGLDEDGEPPRMSGELKHLIDLGADPEMVAQRAKLAGPHSVLRAIRRDDDTRR